MKKKIIGIALIILSLIIILTPFTPGSAVGIIGLDMLFGHKVKRWNNIKKRIKHLLKYK